MIPQTLYKGLQYSIIPLEDSIKKRLLKLHDRFSDLVMNVIDELDRPYHSGPIKLLTVATLYINTGIFSVARSCEVKLTNSRDMRCLFDQNMPLL